MLCNCADALACRRMGVVSSPVLPNPSVPLVVCVNDETSVMVGCAIL
jgi:hypothetical protein